MIDELPRAGDRVTFAAISGREGIPEKTIRNWITRGVTRPDGVQVVLKSFRVGGRRFTTWKWFDEFMRGTARLSGVASSTAPAAPVTIPPAE